MVASDSLAVRGGSAPLEVLEMRENENEILRVICTRKKSLCTICTIYNPNAVSWVKKPQRLKCPKEKESPVPSDINYK